MDDDYTDDHLEADYEDRYEVDDYEPDLDYMFETDSALASAGWGTDEDYGSYGGDEY